jgi:hypothetical protein
MKKEYIILLYNLTLFVVFGFIYSFFIQNQSDFITVPENRDKFSAYYFSATTHTTLGFGDITPVSTLLKSIVMFHTLLVLAGNFGIYVFIKV